MTVLQVTAIVGCSTTKVMVQSNPTKASVYARPVNGQAKLIGETPLDMDAQKLPAEMKNGPVFIEIRKDGFKSSEVLLTDVMGLNVTINRELETTAKNQDDPSKQADGKKTEAEAKKLEADAKRLDSEAKLVLAQTALMKEALQVNGAVDRLFEAQRLTRVGRTDEALQTLRTLKSNFPSLGAIYEMEGGIYFLMKKLPEALDSYRLAMRYSGGSAEPARMTSILEAMLNVPHQTVSAPIGTAPLPENLSPPLVEPDTRAPASSPSANDGGAK